MEIYFPKDNTLENFSPRTRHPSVGHRSYGHGLTNERSRKAKKKERKGKFCCGDGSHLSYHVSSIRSSTRPWNSGPRTPTRRAKQHDALSGTGTQTPHGTPLPQRHPEPPRAQSFQNHPSRGDRASAGGGRRGIGGEGWPAMDAAEELRCPFSDGSVTDLLDARSLHGSPVRATSVLLALWVDFRCSCVALGANCPNRLVWRVGEPLGLEWLARRFWISLQGVGVAFSNWFHLNSSILRSKCLCTWMNWAAGAVNVLSMCPAAACLSYTCLLRTCLAAECGVLGELFMEDNCSLVMWIWILLCIQTWT
jgi:hypothetical protein